MEVGSEGWSRWRWVGKGREGIRGDSLKRAGESVALGGSRASARGPRPHSRGKHGYCVLNRLFVLPAVDPRSF